MKKHRKKFLSLFTVFMLLSSMVFSTPFTAMAADTTLQPTTWTDWTLNNGDILDLNTITDGMDADGKTITVANGGSVKIIGATNKTFENLAINITNGSSVTIENLNITNTTFNSSAIIAGDGNDNNKLIISGTNNIISSVNFYAGISVGESTKLSITNVNTEFNHKLIATGGPYAAGIGGGNSGSGGTINIYGSAEVTATGGTCAAGIGGGCDGSGGTINIYGSAEVIATGGGYSAGIGDGAEGGGGTINIYGSAEVIATGGDQGSGIGGGDNGNNTSNGGVINIYGSAEVTANGGSSGAGIGGGRQGSGGTINIEGSAKVTATGGSYAEGIGSGDDSDSGGTTNIDGSADVTATGGDYAAGIGGIIDIAGNPNIIAFRKSSSEYAVNDLVTSSLPIISGKLSSTLSTDSNVTINVTDTTNSANTKGLSFPSGAYSFFTTVSTVGKYTVDENNMSLVKTSAPTDGIYDLSSTSFNKYNMSVGCKVTFYSQGDTYANKYSFVTSGSKVSNPATDPVKTGCKFEGWYKESSCTNKWSFTTDVVTINTTLYANFTPLAIGTGMTASVAAKTPTELGKVMLTVTGGELDATHKVYYRVVDTDPNAMYVSNVITTSDWSEVLDTSPHEISAADGKYVEVVAVTTADNKITKWGKSVATEDGYTSSYEISLSQTGTLTFVDQTEGYSSLPAQSVTITKTGNENITNLAATLSGTNADKFSLGILSKVTLDSTVTSATFTAKPNDGLTVGTYTATVTVKADNAISKSFDVRFNVTASNGSDPVITPPGNNSTTPAAVTIKGTQKVGNTLSAELIDENQSVTTTSAAVTYNWYRLNSSNSEFNNLVATGTTYTLTSSDLGKYIGLEAIYDGKTFTDKTGMITANSSSSSQSSSASSSSSNSSSNDENTSAKDETTTTGDNQAALADGWNENSKDWKYIKNGQSVTGWNQIDGAWYLMDSLGNMQIGWRQTNGVWYLLKDNGAMAIGWQESNGEWYYLYSDGAMARNTVIDGYNLDGNGVWVK